MQEVCCFFSCLQLMWQKSPIVQLLRRQKWHNAKLTVGNESQQAQCPEYWVSLPPSSCEFFLFPEEEWKHCNDLKGMRSCLWPYKPIIVQFLFRHLFQCKFQDILKSIHLKDKEVFGSNAMANEDCFPIAEIHTSTGIVSFTLWFQFQI